MSGEKSNGKFKGSFFLIGLREKFATSLSLFRQTSRSKPGKKLKIESTKTSII